MLLLLQACTGSPTPTTPTSSPARDTATPGATGDTGGVAAAPAPIAPRAAGDVPLFADLTVVPGAMQVLVIDAAITDDGGICVAGIGFPDGYYDAELAVLLRITASGEPDPAHGTSGFADVGWSPLSDVAAGPDGGCFVVRAPDFYYGSGVGDATVELLDRTGRPDGRFGVWSNDLEPGADRIVDVAGLADGGALVLRAGASLGVVRLLPDGTRDPAFGGDGLADLPIAHDCRTTSFCDHGTIAALPDGRVLATAGHPATVVVLDGEDRARPHRRDRSPRPDLRRGWRRSAGRAGRSGARSRRQRDRRRGRRFGHHDPGGRALILR